MSHPIPTATYHVYIKHEEDDPANLMHVEAKTPETAANCARYQNPAARSAVLLVFTPEADTEYDDPLLTSYPGMTREDFTEILKELVGKMSAAEILSHGEVYAYFSEELNNDVIEIWEERCEW